MQYVFTKILNTLNLKELRNYKRKLYFYPSQKQMKTQAKFQTAVFYNKFTLYHIKPNIYIQKSKFASHKQYLFSLLTTRNAKKTQTDQSIPHVWLLCLKKTTHIPLKVAAAKTLSSSVFVISKLASRNVSYSI